MKRSVKSSHGIRLTTHGCISRSRPAFSAASVHQDEPWNVSTYTRPKAVIERHWRNEWCWYRRRGGAVFHNEFNGWILVGIIWFYSPCSYLTYIYLFIYFLSCVSPAVIVPWYKPRPPPWSFWFEIDKWNRWWRQPTFPIYPGAISTPL